MLDQIVTSPFPSIQPHPALHFPVKQPCTYIEPNRKEKKGAYHAPRVSCPKTNQKSLPIPVPFDPGWSCVFQIPYPRPHMKNMFMRALFVPWEEARCIYERKGTIVPSFDVEKSTTHLRTLKRSDLEIKVYSKLCRRKVAKRE
jgi:hypothetical protein